MPKTSPVETRFPSPVAPPVPSALSRRALGKGLAMVMATALSRLGLFSSPPSPSRVANKEAPQRDTAGAVQHAEVEAKLANIVRKYGSRLSREQREHLRKILAYNEKMLASIRAFSVQNGDSPASVFKVAIARE